MSELTAAAKGCVIQATGQSPGYYRLQGILSTSTSPIFIQSVTTDRKDIAAAISCFGDRHKFYVFGKGFGDIAINLEAFLGADAKGAAETFVNKFFDTNRSSASTKPIIITSRGGGSYSFFLTGCRVTGTNPNNHMMTFQLLGKLVE